MKTCRILPALLLLLIGADYAGYREVWNTPPKTPDPLLHHQTYHSRSMDVEVGYSIYLPPGYDAGTQRYPVIYWLHGLNNSESSDQYPATILDKAIRDGRVKPMIVVYVSGGARAFYSDSPDGKVLSETTIIRELIPHIDRMYRTIAARGGRAIQGMSMGGFGALKLGMKYPDLFSSIVAFAPSLRSWPSLCGAFPDIARRMFGDDPGRFNADHPLTFAKHMEAARLRKLPISIHIGDRDHLMAGARQLHRILLERGIDHRYEEIPGVDHNLAKLSGHASDEKFRFADRFFDRKE